MQLWLQEQTLQPVNKNTKSVIKAFEVELLKFIYSPYTCTKTKKEKERTDYEMVREPANHESCNITSKEARKAESAK